MISEWKIVFWLMMETQFKSAFILGTYGTEAADCITGKDPVLLNELDRI